MIGIRLAESGDVETIARIHVQSWQTAYRGILDDALLDGLRAEDRIPHWREWIRGAGVEVWLAVSGGRTAGFCRLCPARPLADPPERFAEVTHLYVAPDQVGGGFGRRLLGHAWGRAEMQGYRGLLLWVLEGNAGARRFYESQGLAPDGARHDEPDWLGPGVFEVRYRAVFDGRR